MKNHTTKTLFAFAVACCLLTACAETPKPAKPRQLQEYSAEYYNLPIYPHVTTGYVRLQGTLDQCQVTTTDDFKQACQWCVDTFTNDKWRDWELSRETTGGHPGSEFYNLEKGDKQVFITVNSSQGKSFIEYSVPTDGQKWEREHYQVVKPKRQAAEPKQEAAAKEKH